MVNDAFENNEKIFNDQRRPARPRTETTTEHIEQVRCLIDGDPHLTIDEIQVDTGINRRHHSTDYL